MGSSRLDVRTFPADARGSLGFQLRMVQAGERPLDWKPMSSVGPGVVELRVHIGGEFRLVYVARFREAVYVLHCFRKKTQKTPQADLELAKRRFREVLELRREEGFES
jgi:phage-related protein